jgi:hypothetical protein
MNDTPQHDPLRLHADDPEARSVVAAAVDALLAEAATPRLRVELDGDRLAAETVAALVVGLRRVRERGGAIEVTPLRTGVRDAFALAGLDRVFAFPVEPAEVPRRSMLARLTAATFAAVIAFVGLPAGAASDGVTDPTAIIARVVERNPTLNSYQGRLHVDLRMTSFPFYRTTLDGATYYKKPSNYEVAFDRVPRLAKGFEKMFTDIGDASNWEKRFVVTYQGQTDYNGRKDLELRLVQRVRGMIDHETVLVDPGAWAIDSIRYDYYNGGHITMTQSFRQIGGYSMPSEQTAEIAIPYAKAVVRGTYSEYKTNVALDDAVFAAKKN